MTRLLTGLLLLALGCGGRISLELAPPGDRAEAGSGIEVALQDGAPPLDADGSPPLVPESPSAIVDASAGLPEPGDAPGDASDADAAEADDDSFVRDEAADADAAQKAAAPCCRRGVVYWLPTNPDAASYYLCGDAAPQWAPLQPQQSLCGSEAD